MRIGDILSGEVLIDNEEYRNELLEKYPDAIGGEMEGVGVANAALTRAKEWIVIKGICDFADGDKGKNKTQSQQLAAGAAASLCEFIFNHSYVFESLKINAILETPTPQDVQELSIDEEISIDKELPLEEVEIPKIPGLTDNDMQEDIKLTRAFFGLTMINRFRIGLKLGLIDAEEAKKPNKDAVAAQILVRAKQRNLFAQLWTILFDEEKEPNPFK